MYSTENTLKVTQDAISQLIAKGYMDSSAEGKLVSDSHLKRDEDGEWRLINNQLSIEELMGGEDG